MITLSYTTITNCLQKENSHCWLNKQMGLKVPENEAMREGKRLHDLLKSKLDIFPELEGFEFPTSDFDPKMKIEHYNGNYKVIGYVDAVKLDMASELAIAVEFKTGSSMWSIGKFLSSNQIKLYSFISPIITEFICITAVSDEKTWDIQKPKMYRFEVTEDMRRDGGQFVEDAMHILEEGSFKGGLDENGKCNIYCPYGLNCYFKN